MKSRVRETYIDVARGIGITLVVLCHIIITEGYELAWITKFVYAFHMPLFFFISGWCRALGENKVGKEGLPHLWGTIKKLFIPYYIWSFVYLCLAYIGGPVDWEERFQAVYTFRGIAPLWFLPALGLCEIALYLVLTLCKYIGPRVKPFCLILIAAIMFAVAFGMYKYYNGPDYSITDRVASYLFITAGRFFVSFFVMLCGYLLCKILAYVKLPKMGTIVYSIAGAVLLIACFAAVRYSSLSVNLHLFSADRPLWFFFTAVTGSAGLVLLCKGVGRFLVPFRYLGISSLGIMILHYQPFPFMHLASNQARKITGSSLLQVIIATLIVLAISYAGTYVCSRGCFITNKKGNTK